ncbi:adenosylmethionine decarboxylase [Litchfieldia alkalitelluris]|uniref:adenosylmethionine decarboxylase n=1 Tax=Litchfieldia alkalitelluris TaxID=304268 RepID=UPI000997E59B|nr:adenosylmethionine decarboxylase [Litchfieldia alkalitelluris]
MHYETIGKHIILDVWGVDFDILNNVDALEGKMFDSAIASGAGVIGVQSEGFVPQGCTVLLLLSESHFSIHTYPEKRYASIDCYTCGNTVDPAVAVEQLLEFLQPHEVYGKVILRGDGEYMVKEFSDVQMVK